jgi:hypothetical protein
MIKYDYAHQKFHEAVATLAANDLPLSERLLHAFVHIRALDERHLPEDMPEDMRDDFRKLRESGIEDMGRQELNQTASKIVDIMERIDYLYYESVWQNEPSGNH